MAPGFELMGWFKQAEQHQSVGRIIACYGADQGSCGCRSRSEGVASPPQLLRVPNKLLLLSQHELHEQFVTRMTVAPVGAGPCHVSPR